jgi:hypothetical protein
METSGFTQGPGNPAPGAGVNRVGLRKELHQANLFDVSTWTATESFNITVN